jgi:trimethylamine-N-oxide reductase (cytochrome c)
LPTAKDWEKDPIGMIGFYKEPEKHPLTTPTGKLEFYSERLAKYFPDDKERPPMAKWVERGEFHDERRGGKRFKKYPLLIVSNHSRWRKHANMDDMTWLREIPTHKIKGYDGYLYEAVWLHPTDAKARGIKQGDIVKVYNERGIVLGGAYVNERMVPGACTMEHGARVDLIASGADGVYIDRGGANNLIAPFHGMSKNCWGQATSGYLVEVEKLDPAEMEEWRRKYPVAFERAYDPASGLLPDSWIEGGND